MSVDLSIVLPAIRVNLWKRFLDSIDLKNYSYEVIFASPFDWPNHIEKPHNVHMLKTYDTPSVATQKGLLKARGKLIWLTVDDCVLFPGAIDRCMDFYYNNCEERDVINARYREQAGMCGAPLPLSFWFMGSHDDMKLGGIPPHFKISLQPIVNREYILDLGALDCRFTYSNHSLHDLALRIQRDGGKYYDSPVEVTNADHQPNKTGDHAPIHNAQILHDQPIFAELYKQENYRVKIPLDNYKLYEGVWMERFRNQYTSYEQMAKEEGYIL